MSDEYRLTVSVSVFKGVYGYERMHDAEFSINAPLEVLEQIDISGSVYNLFRDALEKVQQEDTEE